MEIFHNIAIETIKVLVEMAPYLLFGFFVAGFLTMFLKPKTVEKHLGKNDFLSVVKASLFGIPLPLCSCGVIPVAASLKKQGASKGATTSFLISTPQTGIDSLIVTYGILGPIFTIIKPVAAFISAIIGGALVNVIDKEDIQPFSQNINKAVESDIKVPLLKKFIHALYYGFVTIPADINKSLILGLLVAGVISASVPDDFFADIFGTGVAAMFVILLFSIPLYVCSTGSIPIAASLIMKGFSPGAALVLLIAGPATNAATITTMWKVLGKKSCIIYLLTMALTAIGSGIFLDTIINNSEITEHLSHASWMLPDYINILSAIILVLLLFYGALEHKLIKIFKKKNASIDQLELIIEGMSCQNCAKTISSALNSLENVTDTVVDHNTGETIIYGKDLQEDVIVKAIESSGFTARVAEESCCKDN